MPSLKTLLELFSWTSKPPTTCDMNIEVCPLKIMEQTITAVGGPELPSVKFRRVTLIRKLLLLPAIMLQPPTSKRPLLLMSLFAIVPATVPIRDMPDVLLSTTVTLIWHRTSRPLRISARTMATPLVRFAVASWRCAASLIC